MAYPVFILIGLLFDIIALAASAGLVYVVFQPDLLDGFVEPLEAMLATTQGRAELLLIGSVFFILSFRGIFLLIIGRGSPEIHVSTGDSGSVSIAHASIEHILRRIVEASGPGSALKASAAKPAGTGAVSIRIRVSLDLASINLNEYTAALDQAVRAHFKDNLGLEVKTFKIRAEYPGRGASARQGGAQA